MTNVQKARVAIVVTWLFAEAVWFLAFVRFLVPRATAGLPSLVAFAIVGFGFLSLPFVSILRGINLESRSDKQWLGLVAAPFVCGVAVFLLLSVSKVLTAVVVLVITGGSLGSFFLKRTHPPAT
jgi:hypothetical protein